MKKSTIMTRNNAIRTLTLLAMLVLCAMPMAAFAQDGGATGTSGAVCKFLGNINGILNIASIAVVTIAIIFAGYQIAFAHKRIADVAPVLIGAVLIGGAAQFAKMILPENTENCMDASGAMIVTPHVERPSA